MNPFMSEKQQAEYERLSAAGWRYVHTTHVGTIIMQRLEHLFDVLQESGRLAIAPDGTVEDIE